MTLRRRQLLGYLGAGVALHSLPSWAYEAPLVGARIGIVGAGIVGASIAYHLARMGARVTVFEQARVAAGATRASFAWINTSTDDEHYARLRMQSVFAWRNLDQQLPLNVSWGGTVMWSEAGNAEAEAPWFLQTIGKTFDPVAYPKYVIDDPAQLARVAPAIAVPQDFESGLHIPLDGHVDPVRCTEQLLAAAQALGAELIVPCEVEDFEFDGSRLKAVSTNRGRHELERIVLAGGTSTPALTARLGYEMPLEHRPGISAHSKPIAGISGVVAMNGNGVLAKQLPDGRIVASDAENPPRMDSGAHAEIIRGEVAMPEALAVLHGERVLHKVGEQIFPAAKGAALEELIVGYRPWPRDGKPIVGRLSTAPDVYVATMHSGVTLAPIIGQYVTRELIANIPVPMLEPYRPERFITGA